MEMNMKQIFVAFIASFALLTFGAEPTKPQEPAKSEMKLAKKRADKEAEAKAAKDASKSQSAKKTETPKK